MDNNTILSTIISSLLDGLVNAVFVGVILWIWQNKYTDKKNKTNIFYQRKQKEEDLFYSNFRKAKNKIYNLFLILTNYDDNKTTEQINEIVSSLQACINQIKISRVALKKYYTNINNLMCKYNEFADVFSRNIRQMNTMTQKELAKANDEIVRLQDEIFFEIENIDKLYFFNNL